MTYQQIELEQSQLKIGTDAASLATIFDHLFEQYRRADFEIESEQMTGDLALTIYFSESKL